MPILITCVCGKTIKAPDGSSGKRAKCPSCNTAIIIPKEVFESDPVLPPTPQLSPIVVTYSPPPAAIELPETQPLAPTRPTDYLVECPYCSEMVRYTAKKCKHCKETIDEDLRAEEVEERRRSKRRGVNQETHVYVQNNNRSDRGFNHGIHIILDVLTFGLWLPFHLLCWACH